MKKRVLFAGLGSAVGVAVAYKFASRPREVRWEQFAHELKHSNHSNFTEIDGLRIHFQEFGEKNAPPIILIHGYTASSATWGEIAPKLAEDGFRVIAPDLIGSGYSSKPFWNEYTIGSQARMISRFMNRLGIGTATIVGSSYGGAVASVLALDYAERVERLVLIDAVSNDHVKEQALARFVAAPVVGELLTPFLVDSKTYLINKMRNGLDRSSHFLITENRISASQAPLRSAEAHNSLLKSLRQWSANRIEREAHKIECETLVIWGENDRVIPIENGRRLFQNMTNARFIVFRDCGHSPQEEYPNDVAELISEFCSAKQISE